MARYVVRYIFREHDGLITTGMVEGGVAGIDMMRLRNTEDGLTRKMPNIRQVLGVRNDIRRR
jgi:hypothetical protein